MIACEVSNSGEEVGWLGTKSAADVRHRLPRLGGMLPAVAFGYISFAPHHFPLQYIGPPTKQSSQAQSFHRPLGELHTLISALRWLVFDVSVLQKGTVKVRLRIISPRPSEHISDASTRAVQMHFTRERAQEHTFLDLMNGEMDSWILILEVGLLATVMTWMLCNLPARLPPLAKPQPLHWIPPHEPPRPLTLAP